MRKKTSLLFSSIETLFSFISASKGINVNVRTNAKIANGLFTDEEVELAIAKFSAAVITTAEQYS